MVVGLTNRSVVPIGFARRFVRMPASSVHPLVLPGFPYHPEKQLLTSVIASQPPDFNVPDLAGPIGPGFAVRPDSRRLAYLECPRGRSLYGHALSCTRVPLRSGRPSLRCKCPEPCDIHILVPDKGFTYRFEHSVDRFPGR